jgi:hypothetical protein
MTSKLLAGFGAVALAAAFATSASACPAHNTTAGMSTPVQTAQNSTTDQTPAPQTSQE